MENNGKQPILYASVAQSVEQLICNQQVGGSSPSTSSNILDAHKVGWDKALVNDTKNIKHLLTMWPIYEKVVLKRHRDILCHTLLPPFYIESELKEYFDIQFTFNMARWSSG